MPTYEYECEKENKRFDAFQKMTDPALTKCPDCGGPVKRLLSGGAGVIFKGTGFYGTDYGRKTHGPSCQSSCCRRDPSSGKLPCEE